MTTNKITKAFFNKSNKFSLVFFILFYLFFWGTDWSICGLFQKWFAVISNPYVKIDVVVLHVLILTLKFNACLGNHKRYCCWKPWYTLQLLSSLWLNVFCKYIGIDCQLSTEELAHQIQKTFANSTRIVWASTLTRILALTQLKKSTNKIECGKELTDIILIIVGFLFLFFFFDSTQA